LSAGGESPFPPLPTGGGGHLGISDYILEVSDQHLAAKGLHIDLRSLKVPVCADLISGRHHLHHILGEVLAGSAGLLLMGRHEPHPSRDVVAAV
jgi:hypothetical protein